MEKLTDLELIELSKINLRRTLNEIQDRATSILLLNLQWKDMENVLNSAQNSVEERLKEVNSKEEEFKERADKLEKEMERREKLFRDEFEELRIKEEELGRQCKDYKERLREIELKQKQVEELKLKEEEFGLKEKGFERRCRDFELEKKDLERRRKDLEFSVKQCEQQCKAVKLMENLVKDKLEEVGLKEKDLEKCLREYELKEEQFGLKEKSFEKRYMEFELEEKAFEERRRDLEFSVKQCEQQFRNCEQQCEEVKLMEKLVKDKLEEVGLKEKDLEKCLREYELKEERFELKEKDLEKCLREYELKEEQFGLKEKSFGKRCMEFELEKKAFKRCRRDLEFSVKQCEQQIRNCEQKCEEVKLMEKLVKDKLEEVELKEKDLEKCLREYELKDKLEQVELKEYELKEKKLAEWSKEFERKRMLASALHPQVNTEPAGSFPVKFSIDHSSPAHLRFCENIDGKDLQMFLNERWKEHGSLGTEVAMALRLSSDPAKLVLDAMEGFYPPHLSKGGREFEGNAVRRSCILLLEQLMKLSPEIKLHVRKEAMKLAFDWIIKMKVEPDHTLEVLGFLQLLASFRLADAFDADELVNFLVFVAQHIQTPELFKVLGLGDKISGFIRKLVERKQHMEAIRFIYAFEQVNEFPPVPVLKDFLNHSKVEARRILKRGKKSPEAKNEANTKRIADLRAVVKCIEDHKLESEYLSHNLKNLNNLIATLEKINASRSLTSPNANRALCTALETPPWQHVGIKRSREFIVTEIAADASLGATTNVSFKKMPSEHLKGSKQDNKIDSKLPPSPLGEQMEESNSKQLQQQYSEKKSDATTSAPAVSSPVSPASAAPSLTAPATISTPEPQENESKRPRTALSQMHYNLASFPRTDLHTNLDRKPVKDYYSWEALARPGDHS